MHGRGPEGRHRVPRARVVASNADANVTFLKLMDAEGPAGRVRRRGQAASTTLSATLKINVALERAAELHGAARRRQAGPQHRGTIHICPDHGLHRARLRRRQVRPPSSNPMLECTMPTAVDDTLAPPGKHILSMFIQYAPYKLQGHDLGRPRRTSSPTAASTSSNEYAPDFKASVIAPAGDPAAGHGAAWGLTGGNIMQGAMTLHSMFSFRPVGGYANYRTPVQGPVPVRRGDAPRRRRDGRCGWNAAREIVRDG